MMMENQFSKEQIKIEQISFSPEEEKFAKQELKTFGLQETPENFHNVMAQKRTLQIPKGAVEIFEYLDNPKKLEAVMKKSKIIKIVHSEGPTVWDHTRAALEDIEKNKNLSKEEKEDLKLIMFYHDLGKTTAADKKENLALSEKNLKKGAIQMNMKGHETEQLDEIKKGLESNFKDVNQAKKKIDLFMTVIINHMNTSLMEMKEDKVIAAFEEFGKNEEERKQVVKLLAEVLNIDGNATEHALLEDDKLVFGKNEKKVNISFDNLWGRYEAALKADKIAKEKAAAKNQQEEFEKEVFGMKLSDYLIKERKIKPGPDFGKAMGKVKGLIAKSKGKSAEEIKTIIDAAKF